MYNTHTHTYTYARTHTHLSKKKDLWLRGDTNKTVNTGIGKAQHIVKMWFFLATWLYTTVFCLQ